MHVPPNIIRFPAPAPASNRAAESAAKPNNIVAFQSRHSDAAPASSETGNAPSLSAEARARGQVFAAHRIVARVADQLDAIAAL